MLNILFGKKEIEECKFDNNEEINYTKKQKFSFFKAFIALTCMFAVGGAVFVMSLFLFSTIFL